MSKRYAASVVIEDGTVLTLHFATDAKMTVGELRDAALHALNTAYPKLKHVFETTAVKLTPLK